MHTFVKQKNMQGLRGGGDELQAFLEGRGVALSCVTNFQRACIMGRGTIFSSIGALEMAMLDRLSDGPFELAF